MIYRLNYGNGQVSGSFDTLREALTMLKLQLEYDRRWHETGPQPVIERYEGGGDWFRASPYPTLH